MSNDSLELFEIDMAVKKRRPADRMRPKRVPDLVVLPAMGLVTVALAVGLVLQGDVPIWLAMTLALIANIGMLAVHELVKRSDRLELLAAEVARLEAEVQRLGAASRSGSTARTRAAGQAAAGSRTPAEADGLAAETARSAQAWREQAVAVPPSLEAALPAQIEECDAAAAEDPAAEREPALPAAGNEESASAARELSGGDGSLPWSYRPADSASDTRVAEGAWPELTGPARDAGEPALTNAPEAVAAEAPEGDSGTEAPSSPREADVEMIQGLIKKLAAQVNAAETAAHVSTPNADSRAVDAAIRESLMALRTTADQMRTPSLPEPAEPARPLRATASATPPPAATASAATLRTPPAAPPSAALPGEMPYPRVPYGKSIPARSTPAPEASAASAPPPRARDRLADIGEALSEGRFEVLLDPILGLGDQRARHYEVSLELRDRAGVPIENGTDAESLGGTGLLPLVDSVRLNRSALVARRLAEKGRAGSLFSAASGEALGSDRFLSDFADAYAQRADLAHQLVLTFPQSDVMAFGGRDWETLAEMRELGFRFALGAVTSLDMDFEALRHQGFEYVKLDAEVFLGGMPASGGIVPAADICRHLAGLGMALIVGEIEDEAQLARIFGFGVLFGQGALFGGPRPMKIGGRKGAGHLAA